MPRTAAAAEAAVEVDMPEPRAALMVEATVASVASVAPNGGGGAPGLPRVAAASVDDPPAASTSTSQPPATSTPSSPVASPPSDGAVDFTALPHRLEAAYSRLDAEAAIRPTRVAIGEVWSRRAQKALLAPPVQSELHSVDQGREKQKAFDLLDALSRSGALSFDSASLHVLVAATHVFDESLMDTVISANANPIEKLERSSLIVAMTVHGTAATSLLSGEHRERVSQFSAPAPAASNLH